MKNNELRSLKEKVNEANKRNKELVASQFKTSDWTGDEYFAISDLAKASLKVIRKEIEKIEKIEKREELIKLYMALKNNANSEVTIEVIKAINVFIAILGI